MRRGSPQWASQGQDLIQKCCTGQAYLWQLASHSRKLVRLPFGAALGTIPKREALNILQYTSMLNILHTKAGDMETASEFGNCHAVWSVMRNQAPCDRAMKKDPPPLSDP